VSGHVSCYRGARFMTGLAAPLHFLLEQCVLLLGGDPSQFLEFGNSRGVHLDGILVPFD
jgi:hypothetical protein